MYGRPVRGHAAVIEPGNSGVLQAGENLALDMKPRQLGYRLLPEEFDGYPLMEVAFGPLAS